MRNERDLSGALTPPGRSGRIYAPKRNQACALQLDYVFDGTKTPYTETDTAIPESLRRRKIFGEEAVLRVLQEHLVLRTSWVFDWHPTQTKTFSLHLKSSA